MALGTRRLIAAGAVVTVAAVGAAVTAARNGGGDIGPAANPAGSPDAVAAFVGWDSGTAERLRVRFEEAVAGCMASQGLTYTVPEPVPQRTGGIFGAPLTLFGARDRVALDEYKRRFGYGMASRFDELRLARADNARDQRDPIALQLAGVEPLRRQDWQASLERCRQEVDRMINPDPAILDRLEDAYEDMEDRLAEDPRSRDLDRRWQSCLEAKGFPYADEEEIRDHLMPGLVEAAGPTGRQTGDGFVLGVRALETGGDHESDEFAAIDKQALDRLRGEEMAIAAADLECRAQLRHEADALRAGYEAAFVDEHRIDLEAVRARWAAHQRP